MDYYRPTPFEVATGWVHGLLPALEVEADDRTPRQVLVDLVRPALARPPCFVAFSGGRDSSAVLAVTTSVARAQGLADPVPVTEVYPDIPATDEGGWQRLVVEHLGLSEWVRLEFHQQNDMLGPAAQDGLRRRGVVWPSALQAKANLFAALSPGTLLTGEGGDEVFGARRAAPWPHLKKGTTGRRAAAAQGALQSLLPRMARQRQELTKLRQARWQPWLRPAVTEDHLRMIAADQASEPLRWDRSLLWLPRRRASAMTAHNYRGLAGEYAIEAVDPLLGLEFLAAVGRAGGRWGYPGRTAAMSTLFGDLLPRPVIERRTKALFNSAFFGSSTHAFADDWDGGGVDPALVDVDRLRTEWQSEQPSALSGTLLQAAWLHSVGGHRGGQATGP